jgi:hypothetical protein
MRQRMPKPCGSGPSSGLPATRMSRTAAISGPTHATTPERTGSRP